MRGWEVVFYETQTGECPVQQYLDRAKGSEAARIVHDIRLLESLGLNLGFPYVSHVEDKVFELRTRGQQVHRVLYFAASGRQFVLLHAFMKKTGKTPLREIRIARER